MSQRHGEQPHHARNAGFIVEHDFGDCAKFTCACSAGPVSEAASDNALAAGRTRHGLAARVAQLAALAQQAL
jgi:hypothetical protein